MSPVQVRDWAFVVGVFKTQLSTVTVVDNSENLVVKLEDW